MRTYQHYLQTSHQWPMLVTVVFVRPVLINQASASASSKPQYGADAAYLIESSSRFNSREYTLIVNMKLSTISYYKKLANEDNYN